MNIDVVPIHHDWQEPRESMFAITYGNGFATLLECKRSGYKTMLTQLSEDEEWEYVEDTKQMHFSFEEAMVWVLKWYYYT